MDADRVDHATDALEGVLRGGLVPDPPLTRAKLREATGAVVAALDADACELCGSTKTARIHAADCPRAFGADAAGTPSPPDAVRPFAERDDKAMDFNEWLYQRILNAEWGVVDCEDGTIRPFDSSPTPTNYGMITVVPKLRLEIAKRDRDSAQHALREALLPIAALLLAEKDTPVLSPQMVEQLRTAHDLALVALGLGWTLDKENKQGRVDA